MITLKSKTGIAKGKQEAVYNYISDFRNFAGLLPEEKLQDVKISENTLLFGIPGLGNVGLKISERNPYKQLVINAIEGTAADFTFWININDAPDNNSTVNIDLEANLNMFLEMMAKGPLQQFLDLMIDKVQLIQFEKSV